jgi:hypothetical protein
VDGALQEGFIETCAFARFERCQGKVLVKGLLLWVSEACQYGYHLHVFCSIVLDVKVPCCCIMLAEMNVMLVESINICCKL